MFADPFMPEEFDVVHYPFKVKSKDDVLLYRVEDGYEMRFTRSIFSKRVCSSVNSLQKKYIEIEIDEKGIIALSEFQTIHEFITPADFYVPQCEDALKFYSEVHSSLVGDDLERLTKMAVEIDKKVKSGKSFPEFPLPISTTMSHFENYKTASAKLETFPHVPIIQIKSGDQVPCQASRESESVIRSVLSRDQYNAQEQFYKSFFGSMPISRFRTVAEKYDKSPSDLKDSISLNILKRCVGLHAYFFTSGPWRKCWVRLGYDPTTDSENYKYQVVEMRTKKANFQIFQRPEIEAEVVKNKEWYVLKEFDPVDGFVSKALKNFIIYTIDEKGIQDINDKIGELQDMDFELFD